MEQELQGRTAEVTAVIQFFLPSLQLAAAEAVAETAIITAVFLLQPAVAAEALPGDSHLLEPTEQADKEMPAGRRQVLDLFTLAAAVVRVLPVVV